MSLHWNVISDRALVIVEATGAVRRRDIEDYLAATILQGVKSYKKLIVLMRGVLTLSPEDLDIIAKELVRYGEGEAPGPVAIVVGGRLNLDMAMLLKQRVGSRPFRIFVTMDAALEWLAFFDKDVALEESVPAGGKPQGGGWRSYLAQRALLASSVNRP